MQLAKLAFFFLYSPHCAALILNSLSSPSLLEQKTLKDKSQARWHSKQIAAAMLGNDNSNRSPTKHANSSFIKEFFRSYTTPDNDPLLGMCEFSFECFPGGLLPPADVNTCGDCVPELIGLRVPCALSCATPVWGRYIQTVSADTNQIDWWNSILRNEEAEEDKRERLGLFSQWDFVEEEPTLPPVVAHPVLIKEEENQPVASTQMRFICCWSKTAKCAPESAGRLMVYFACHPEDADDRACSTSAVDCDICGGMLCSYSQAEVDFAMTGELSPQEHMIMLDMMHGFKVKGSETLPNAAARHLKARTETADRHLKTQEANQRLDCNPSTAKFRDHYYGEFEIEMAMFVFVDPKEVEEDRQIKMALYQTSCRRMLTYDMYKEEALGGKLSAVYLMEMSLSKLSLKTRCQSMKSWVYESSYDSSFTVSKPIGCKKQYEILKIPQHSEVIFSTPSLICDFCVGDQKTTQSVSGVGCKAPPKCGDPGYCTCECEEQFLDRWLQMQKAHPGHGYTLSRIELDEQQEWPNRTNAMVRCMAGCPDTPLMQFTTVMERKHTQANDLLGASEISVHVISCTIAQPNGCSTHCQIAFEGCYLEIAGAISDRADTWHDVPDAPEPYNLCRQEIDQGSCTATQNWRPNVDKLCLKHFCRKKCLDTLPMAIMYVWQRDLVGAWREAWLHYDQQAAYAEEQKAVTARGDDAIYTEPGEYWSPWIKLYTHTCKQTMLRSVLWIGPEMQGKYDSGGPNLVPATPGRVPLPDKKDTAVMDKCYAFWYDKDMYPSERAFEYVRGVTFTCNYGGQRVLQTFTESNCKASEKGNYHDLSDMEIDRAGPFYCASGGPVFGSWGLDAHTTQSVRSRVMLNFKLPACSVHGIFK